MTQFSRADGVYGDGELPADADFSAPTGKVAEVSPFPAQQSDAESTTTTVSKVSKKQGGKMTDSADSTGKAREPDGKFTDEEFKDGSHTPDRAAGHSEEGEYTDSDLSETDKDHPERHD